MVFTVSEKNYLGNHATIVDIDAQGREIPVLHIVPGEIDFPGDMDRLAANVAAILNGNPPLYKIETGSQRLYWQTHENGITLRSLRRDARADHDMA